jgi:hypothetical protein
LKKWLIINTIIIVSLGNVHLALAHQTPSTVVLLDVSPKQVAVELQLPIGELELAFGQNLSKNPAQIIPKNGATNQRVFVGSYSSDGSQRPTVDGRNTRFGFTKK